MSLDPALLLAFSSVWIFGFLIGGHSSARIQKANARQGAKIAELRTLGLVLSELNKQGVRDRVTLGPLLDHATSVEIYEEAE